MLGDGHKLHMGEAHFLDIGGKVTGELPVGEGLALGVAAPGAEMYLVDVEGLVINGVFVPVGHPAFVSPTVACQVIELGGGAGTGLGVEGIGIRLQPADSVGAGNGVFVDVVLLYAGKTAFPNAVANGLHGVGVLGPAVKIAHQGYRPGVGRPDPEHPPLLFGVRTHIQVSIGGFSGGKFWEHLFLCAHYDPPIDKVRHSPEKSKKTAKYVKNDRGERRIRGILCTYYTACSPERQERIPKEGNIWGRNLRSVPGKRKTRRKRRRRVGKGQLWDLFSSIMVWRQANASERPPIWSMRPMETASSP